MGANGLRVRSTGEDEEADSGRTDSQSVSEVNEEAGEATSLNGLRVRSTGEVTEEAPEENHYPMSNRFRRLVKEYEKKHGKQQKVGETYREMFDRVVGICLGNNRSYGPMKQAESSLKLKAESLNGEGENAEEENAVCEMLSD